MPKPLRVVMLLSFSFGFFVADVLSKWASVVLLRDRPPWVLLPILDFRYVENRDIAFSLMEWIPERIRPTLILTLGCIMTLYVIFLFVRYAAEDWFLGFGLASILAGALGNLLDRITRGYVVDFIHIHYKTYSWPVFNIADICVTTGIALIALGLFFMPPEAASVTAISTDSSASSETSTLSSSSSSSHPPASEFSPPPSPPPSTSESSPPSAGRESSP